MDTLHVRCSPLRNRERCSDLIDWDTRGTGQFFDLPILSKDKNSYSALILAATDSRLLGSFCPHGMAFLLQACRSYCRCDFMDKTQLACLNVSVVFCCIIYNIQYIIWMYDYVVFFAWNQKLQRFKDAVRTPSLWTLEVIAFDRDEWRGHGTEVASDRPWVWSRLRDMPEVAAVLSDTTREASEWFAGKNMTGALAQSVGWIAPILF